MIVFHRLVVSIVLAGLLIGCGSTSRALFDTIKVGFSSAADVTLSLEQVTTSDFDLIYIRPNDSARATMVLAYLEHGQHKWLSADGVMLVMEQGRIVRTLGLPNNLTYVSNTTEDPLRLSAGGLTDVHWTRVTDWQLQQQSGYQMHSTFTEQYPVELSLFEHSFNTRLVKERVVAGPRARAIENLFWFDAASGILLQSRQQLAPHSPVFEVTYISQAARLITAGVDGREAMTP